MNVHAETSCLQAGHACVGYALGAAAFAAGIQRFSLINALAQGSDYRALVCIFLAGGNDGNNMVVPWHARNMTPMQRSGAPPALRSPATVCFRLRRPASAPRSGFIRVWWSCTRSGASRSSPSSVTSARSSSLYKRNTRAAPRVRISSSRIRIRSRSGRRRLPIGLRQSGWGGRTADRFGRHSSGLPMITALSGGIFTRGDDQSPLSIAPAPTALNRVLVLNGFGTAADEWRAGPRWSFVRIDSIHAGRLGQPNDAAGARHRSRRSTGTCARRPCFRIRRSAIS